MLARFFVLLAFLMGPAVAAWGADELASASEQAPAEHGTEVLPEALEVEPVVIDGQSLFSVRGIRGYSASKRAEAVAARIVAIARNDSFAANTIRLEARPLGPTIMAGDLALLTVLEADARVEGIERGVLAQVYLELLGERQAARLHRRVNGLDSQSGIGRHQHQIGTGLQGQLVHEGQLVERGKSHVGSPSSTDTGSFAGAPA